MHRDPGGFTPPPYPYERLEPMKAKADAHEGGAVDLSIGTPNDAPPAAVIRALGSSGAERGYPASVGTPQFRGAVSEWMQRRLAVTVDPATVGACIGTKEFVGSLPQYLHLRDPARDTVLYPALSYPTYEMGATLAGLRAVPVAVDEHWRLDLGSVSEEDAERALVLWVNSPGNPAGQIEDLAAAAAWGRRRGIPVCSDECYLEFTWDGPAATVLHHGIEGVIALHSLSKRSNLAGVRAGFYAGDPDLVEYLREVRKHAGFMVPGPVQAAAVAALEDDEHVAEQRGRYEARIDFFQSVLAPMAPGVRRPGGGFYLWARAPEGDSWAFAERLAAEGGALVTPGDTFGPAGAGYVRVALVQPMERLQLVADRLAAAGS